MNVQAADPNTSIIGEALPNRKKIFVSIRLKMLIPLAILLTILMLVFFVWLNLYLSDMFETAWTKDIDGMLTVISDCMTTYGDEYEELIANPGDDPTNSDEYVEIYDTCLAYVSALNPNADIYTYRLVEGEPNLIEYKMSIFDENFSDMIEVTDEEMTMYRDGLKEKFFSQGIWTTEKGDDVYSGFAPIKNSAGETIAGIEISMLATEEADAILAAQSFTLIAFPVALLVILGITFLIINASTASIRSLDDSTEEIGEGNYKPVVLRSPVFRDEITDLQDSFNRMIAKVSGREASLKQQVQELQIIIDHDKQAKQVEEITDNEFFRDLQERSKSMRKRAKDASEDDPKPA